MRILGTTTILALSMLSVGHASAMTLNFLCVTQDNSISCSQGEQQLSVNVTAADTSAGEAGTFFLFRNSDPDNTISPGFSPSVHEIYFQSSLFGDDFFVADNPPPGQTSDVILIEDLDKVNFTLDTLDPPNLPGGNEVDFTADWGTESVDSNIRDSLQEGDELTVNILTLEFDAFTAALITGDFRIGLHVRRFEGDISQSFVSTVIPLPASVWLFGSALLGFIGFARRRTN